MSTGMKAIVAGFVLAGSVLICQGCRSDGQTTRLDYTYDQAILMDASSKEPTAPKK